jgi:phage baseplate assembly protein W
MAVSLSRADKITASSVTRLFFSDFTDDFTKHPVTSTLAIVRNADSVKQGFKNLILTDPGERFFNPYFGCGIRGSLGEPDDPFIVEEVTRQISLSVSQFEKRISLMNVSVSAASDQNQLNVSVTFRVSNQPDPITVSLLVSRVR